VNLLRYTSSPPVCLCGLYRNICTFYLCSRPVRIATKTYVKKSFTISPIRPKWCKDWPCTSHIALRRQALPSIPKLVSKSSTTIYRSALWKQKNTGNHSSKYMNLYYCCCILSLFWNLLLQFLQRLFVIQIIPHLSNDTVYCTQTGDLKVVINLIFT